jgi:hypothetical protein
MARQEQLVLLVRMVLQEALEPLEFKAIKVLQAQLARLD